MNSTRKEELTTVDQFFYETLVPLAKTLRKKDALVFFHKRPDPAKETYFIKRKKTSMTPDDFEVDGCKSPDDLKKALVRLWMAEGHTELPIIADSIVKLAESIHHTEEQSCEVSPFIYVMF